MKIGIAALGAGDGLNGGVDVYTRLLVEALAKFDQHNQYDVLVDVDNADAWDVRAWPHNVKRVIVYHVEPRRSLPVRIQRRAFRSLHLATPTIYGKDYIAHQIDGRALDLIHFPSHVISPLSVATTCVLTFFDLQHEYYPQFFTNAELAWRAGRYRPSVEKARHIMASSNFTKDTLVEKYGVPPGKISTVPVGLPERFRRVSEPEVARLLQKYQLPRQFLYYPANPWPHKNHARLLAALRVHGHRYGSIPPLVVSGRLAHEVRSVRDLATAAGVEAYVVDVGFVPRQDCMALYSAAAAMIFPSLFEGFGMPLVEAMACGCPIGAARCGSIPEVAGDAALLFDPCDIDDIAEAIHSLLHDAELRARLMEGGYRQLRRFDWSAIVPQLLEIYRAAATCRAERSYAG